MGVVLMPMSSDANGSTMALTSAFDWLPYACGLPGCSGGDTWSNGVTDG